MATLRANEKRFIVERLACFDQPADVVRDFAQAFPGRTVTPQQVANFDGARAWARERMSSELRSLFDATRRRFKDEIEDVAIANKSFRLRSLLRLAQKAEGVGNIKAAAEMYEQAAKEMGGAYTNRATLDVTSAGAPLSAAAALLARDADPGELAALYLERIRGGAAGGGAAQA